MRSTNRRIAPWGFLLVALSVLALTACGKSKADETPTPGVEEIFTAAFQTFEAQQATEMAMTPPTQLASPTLFPTLPPPSPISTIGFGTATLSSGGAGCNNATFVNDVTIPDDTVVDAGEKFDKTWQLLNSGTCSWTTAYKIAFDGGDQMGGATTNLKATVPAGTVVDITVTLTAPTDAGTYKGFWRLQNDQGVSFGNRPWVQIKVGAAATSTLSSADLTGTATALGTPP